MTKRERTSVAVLILILLSALSYFLVFKDMFAEISVAKSQVEADEIIVNEYENSAVVIKELNNTKEQAELVAYANFKDYLSTIKQEEIILLINEILLRSDIKVSAINFSDFERGATTILDYETFNVSISLEGGYKEVMDFISSFWRFDHNIYVSQLNLSESEESLSGTVDAVFVRVNNAYASDTLLFKWYTDILYQKEDPFDGTDFSNLFLPNYFYTGTDVEFYNPEYEAFNDISGHWAENILNTFGRNGYLLGDDSNNIKPDEPMTRLETVLLLDLVFRWEMNEEFANLESFDDYDLIESLEDLSKKSLIKAYSSGYLYGYDDNTLRPLSNISYEELGYIGANLLGDEGLTWDVVAKELESLTGYTSKGIESNKEYATKAEIVYFLAYIDDRLDD